MKEYDKLKAILARREWWEENPKAFLVLRDIVNRPGCNSLIHRVSRALGEDVMEQISFLEEKGFVTTGGFDGADVAATTLGAQEKRRAEKTPALRGF